MHSGPPSASSPALPERVRATVERIAASPAFKNSKQCQRFLEHVVNNTLNGHEEQLKERSIGMDVFGRDAGYDTSNDPVVRVRATEVRKRLAQYYQESGQPGDVRIELPTGSYRVEFHDQPGQPLGDVAPAPPKSRRWLIGAVAGGVCAIGAGAWVTLRKPPGATALDQFWAPALDSPRPVIIYCGQPVVYFLSRDVHSRFGNPSKAGASPLNIPPDAKLSGRDIIPVTEQFVGIGNAHTSALLAGFCAHRSKAVEIRYASDISFTDLRSGPAVLIGAFSNLWTLEMTAQFRFVFEREEGAGRIRDRSAEDRVYQLSQQSPDGKTPEDYALVTRQVNSATGQVLITAAGITQYGTRAAGELITDSNRLNSALAGLQENWSSKNLQLLLHTTVYKGTPGPPRVLATQVW